MASRVRPALSDNELVDIFMGTLQGLYFEKMIGSSSTNFDDMITIGERVESGLKSGKITDTTAQQTTNKRLHGGFANKKKGKANAVTARARPRYQFPTAHMPYYPYPYVAAAQYQQPPFQVSTVSDPCGSYCTKRISAVSPPFNRRHNPNATCAYHTGYIEHSTKDCWTLKKRIQELIDQEILSFSEEKPNVKTNSLPNHDGATVHTVIKEESTKVVLRVEEVKILMSIVLQRLEQFGFLEGVHDDCTVCEFDPDNCEQLKGCVQGLMDQGLTHFSKSQAAEEVAVIKPITIVYRKNKVEAPPRRIQPIHLCVPIPFSYQNTKAMPWNYETTAYLGGKEICIPDT
ncbi:uncharacterized protein LOC127086894 [Lathyrus oleraceus]|uniref:uncharacterized protein LOC127086894 n=1 Tax=Pisum sativum TaxID=3888 RepID=UPI0021D346F0|nr:uncharacterized protein LOC127086894 [Pisum sativum]